MELLLTPARAVAEAQSAPVSLRRLDWQQCRVVGGRSNHQGSRNLTSCLPGVLVGKLELKGNPVSDLATGPTLGEAPRAGPRTAALGLGGCAGPRPQHRSIAARRSDPD